MKRFLTILLLAGSGLVAAKYGEWQIGLSLISVALLAAFSIGQVNE